jgi:Tfp pilus assembly protein PilV
MQPIRRTADRSDCGMTLVEVVCAASLLVIAILALGAVLLSASRGREQMAVRNMVLAGAQNLLEEINATPSNSLVSTYHNHTRQVAGVTGANVNGATLAVSVDSSNPRLLGITVSAAWQVLGVTETMVFQSQVYNP